MEENIINIQNIEENDFPSEPIIIEISDEKPFNKCLTCKSLSDGCIGLNLIDMPVEYICEFLQLRRIILGYTYQKTADLSNLSLITVKRYLTNKVKDPSFLILQALIHTLVCDPKGKYSCPIHISPDEAEQATAACKAAQEALALKEQEFERNYAGEHDKTMFLKDQLLFAEEQMKEKDRVIDDWNHIMRIKDRYICVLSIALGAALAIIIGALVLDIISPTLGFIWRTGI